MTFLAKLCKCFQTGEISLKCLKHFNSKHFKNPSASVTREKKNGKLKKSILEFIKFVLFHSRYVFDEGNELSFKMRTCTYAKKMFERLKVYDNSSSQRLVTWHMWQMWLPPIHSLRNTDLNWFVYSKKLLKRRWWNWHLDTILWKKLFKLWLY